MNNNKVVKILNEINERQKFDKEFDYEFARNDNYAMGVISIIGIIVCLIILLPAIIKSFC